MGWHGPLDVRCGRGRALTFLGVPNSTGLDAAKSKHFVAGSTLVRVRLEAIVVEADIPLSRCGGRDRGIGECADAEAVGTLFAKVIWVDTFRRFGSCVSVAMPIANSGVASGRDRDVDG